MEDFIQGVGGIVAEEQGKERAAALMEAARGRLEQLLRENSAEPPAVRRHTHQKVYPAIAAYEALLEAGTEPEKAVWYIHEYYQRYAAKVGRRLRGLLRLPALYHLVPAVMGKRASKGFPEEAGFQYRWPAAQRKGEVRFDMVRCPYADTCRRYGHPELTCAFCDGDDAGYGDLHPKLKWGRTKTLGKGGDCCDFKMTDLSKTKA